MKSSRVTRKDVATMAGVSAISGLRLYGYRQSLESAGVGFDPVRLIECEESYAAGCEAMERLPALADPPIAIFTHATSRSWAATTPRAQPTSTRH